MVSTSTRPASAKKGQSTMSDTPDYTSLVPHYTFPNTLEEQREALATNPLLQRMNEVRKGYEGDPHRPIYHYVNPEHTLNDPNGICFWQGRWHLFYQAYPPEDPRQHWGHAISDDLIHWEDLPYAIYPNPERCCFSGINTRRRRPRHRHVSRHHGWHHGRRIQRPPALELGKSDWTGRNPHAKPRWLHPALSGI